MSMRGKVMRLAILMTIGLSLFVAVGGCDRIKAGAKNDVVAYVNKEPIFANELKRDIALRAKYDPTFRIMPDTETDQLDVIIDRKLIVQSAIERGLAREERFVNTIRAFWEQVLIRDFIDYKKKELEDYLFVTDDDIRKYYDNMSWKATFKILKSKDKARMDELYKKYLKDNDTSNWQTVGPISYEDATSNVLLDAFEMEKGEAKIFDDGRNYYLTAVFEKEAATIEPLETLKPQIGKRAAALKERRLFENWLKTKRKKSIIKIKRENL